MSEESFEDYRLPLGPAALDYGFFTVGITGRLDEIEGRIDDLFEIRTLREEDLPVYWRVVRNDDLAIVEFRAPRVPMVGKVKVYMEQMRGVAHALAYRGVVNPPQESMHLIDILYCPINGPTEGTYSSGIEL